MKLWTALSPINEDARWKNFSQHLSALGVANEYVPWEGELNDLTDVRLLDKFHFVRISSRIGGKMLRLVKVQSTWVTVLGVVDGMVKREDNKWWPQCALFESYGTLLFRLGADLDTRGSVLIAGIGGASKVAIAAFFKSGFRHFLLTSADADEAQKFIADVQSRFFGMTLTWVPMERIVSLPGESSVLVNCTPQVEENDLLVELSYLNFLKRPGFLFDIARSQAPSVLRQEALDAGVKVISGVQIAALADVLWAKWAFGVELPMESYQTSFEALLT